MDIDKFIKDKGLKIDCIVESDLDAKEYVQYEVRELIKEAVNEQLRLCIVSKSVAKQYAEFCVICDREGLPLLELDDYIKQYCC